MFPSWKSFNILYTSVQCLIFVISLNDQYLGVIYIV